MSTTVAAVDLGATSGRVMLGRLEHGRVSLIPVGRFPNSPVRTPDGLHWNVLELHRGVVDGLREGFRVDASIASIGIDSWAIDYGLLRGGRLVGIPFHYRDERTAAAVDRVHSVASHAELFRRNGLQFLPFNTIYQFDAERVDGLLDLAEHALLIPDLIASWLTGAVVAERTNASTTGLLGVETGEWDLELARALGIPARILPPLVSPGDRIGELLPAVAADLGGSAPVTAIGSHDTASAVVAIPAESEHVAYISCGTWGLVGVELPAPVLTDEARDAGFTNEAGVDGRVRLLHNVMGLWLLSESVRTWQRTDPSIELIGLLDAAAQLTREVAVFDANDPRFLAPGDIPERIRQWCLEHGQEAPSSPVHVVRSIVESLAQAFADAVRTASAISGRRVETIHIVGGGSQNALLCRRTAERSGIPVVAGPVEATALGNVLVQARAIGAIDGTLEDLRRIVIASTELTRYD
jgi:rhamnulokinase